MKILPWIVLERNPRTGANERIVGVRVTLSFERVTRWLQKIRGLEGRGKP